MTGKKDCLLISTQIIPLELDSFYQKSYDNQEMVYAFEKNAM